MKKTNFRKASFSFFLIPALVLFSCSKDNDSQTDKTAEMIKEVRETTNTYKSHAAALDAGWDTDLSGCVAHPTEGGMGHHFGRLEFLDGRINHLEPQVLLYGTDDNGNMEFYGVEYIVPFAIHPADAEPPVLFGHEFHPNHEQQIWALHVWTEKENPKGMFNDWNPHVKCE